MKRKKFEEKYAKRSGITVEQGYERGIFPAIKCDCWEEDCEGWRRRYEDDGPAPGKACKRHAYGGFRTGQSAIFGSRGAVLLCRWCGKGYVPGSAYMVKPIGLPVYDCPHPVFGESRWHKDDPWVQACQVCGAAQRFTPVPCVGGPRDGEIEPTLITPEDGTSVGSWRIMATTKGQEPDENGSTLCWSYTLRFGPDGMPRWEGRSSSERAQDAQAAVTA